MPANTSSEITVRLATLEDVPAVVRLAALDSAQPPQGKVLLAESGGVPVAALSLDGGRSIADPFQHTAALVQMLELRAAQLRAAGDLRPPASLAQRVRGAARSLSPRTP